MIIDPNVNPEEQRMALTILSRNWDGLKEILAKFSLLELSIKDLEEKISSLRLNGPSESINTIEEYVRVRQKAFNAMNAAIKDLSSFEFIYFKWISSTIGEELLNNKLAQAMKGLENE